ncbi:U3 snoRNP protein [Globomyces sp. JEL0801]|nr:U3 snoRNP protein [Globomyces sp. JEL0801]
MADAVHYELEKMIPELEDLQEREEAITLSDYSIVRRIHAIYLKTLKKFSNDIRIWVQYFDWSIKAKSCRTLGKNFARAIQLHPTKSIFWIMAASYEFEQNHNITSARILLQRAIRINPQDQKLWLEYFKLELLWIFKLKERRRVLFQEKKVDSVPVNSSDEQEGVELPKLSNENEDDDVFEKDSILAQSRAENTTELMNEKLSATQQALVQLSIPRAVYRNAIIYIPNDVDFRLSFLDIYHTFDLDSIAAQTDIFDSLKQDFPAEPKVIKIICERHIVKYKSDDPEYPIALGKTVQEYIEHLNEAGNSTLWVYFVEFLTLQQTKCDEPNLLKYLSMNLQYAFEQSDTNGLATISIYLSWYKQSKDIKIIEKGLTYHPNSSFLWIERIEFETSIENRIELFKQAVELSLNRKYLGHSIHETEILQKYCHFILQTKGFVDFRRLTDELIKSKTQSIDFVYHIIQIETNEYFKVLDSVLLKRIEMLWDVAHRIDRTHADMWMNHISFEFDAGQHNKAAQLYWIACKEVDDLEAFEQRYQDIKN